MSEWKDLEDLKKIFQEHHIEFRKEDAESFSIAEALAFMCEEIERLKHE